ETRSWPGRSEGAISASTSPMSWGLTTRTTVSALAVTSALPSTVTPYRSSSSAARSRRFSPTIRVSPRRPAPTSPDRRASPITPAPMIAVCFGVAMTAIVPLLLADQRLEEHRHVAGLLGETAHQVAVPLAAVGDVDAHGLAGLREAPLLGRPDPVEHLELVAPL